MKTYYKPELEYIALQRIDVLLVSGNAEDFGDFDYDSISIGGNS